MAGAYMSPFFWRACIIVCAAAREAALLVSDFDSLGIYLPAKSLLAVVAFVADNC